MSLSFPYYFYLSIKTAPRYRYDPVPYTGKRGHYCYLKRFSTYQEKRITCGHLADGWYTRRRRYKSLPDPWDDIVRSDVGHRSWKQQTKRKKQWRMKYEYELDFNSV